MTDEQLQEMRSRITELEERDEDFARRSNLLLDEILVTREQADSNTRTIDNLLQVSAEGRRDIDQLAPRMGELAQSISELRQSTSDVTQNVQLVAFTVSQMVESMTILRQTQQTTTDRFVETFARFQEQAALDRQSFQAEIQRIWEYLLSQHPNGRGEQGGSE
jgi:chromosome segregation ATPase